MEIALPGRFLDFPLVQDANGEDFDTTPRSSFFLLFFLISISSGFPPDDVARFPGSEGGAGDCARPIGWLPDGQLPPVSVPALLKVCVSSMSFQ